MYPTQLFYFDLFFARAVSTAYVAFTFICWLNRFHRSVKGSTKVGIPGSNDLETALRRLELRKQNVEAERKYHAEHPTDSSEVGTPTCPTPDSFLSSLSGMSTGGFHGGYRSFMPEKLQIVKPMEGAFL